MKYLLWLFLLVFNVNFGFSQENSTAKKELVICKKLDAGSKFKADLKSETFDLYVMSGLLPAHNKYEVEFQKKYKVNYIKMGCVVTDDINECTKYNKLVFDFLNEKYGTAWRKMVLEQTLGI